MSVGRPPIAAWASVSPALLWTLAFFAVPFVAMAVASLFPEGAVLWSQSLAMFKDSKHPDLALKFIQYVLSPEGQARLATSACYWGMPANTKAALNDEQKTILRFAEQPDFLKRAQPYPAPSEELDKKMQDVWTEMIQAQ